MATVEEGDCAVSIAAKLGFRSYRILWEANASLHATRPNPNMLAVGDDLVLPEKVQTVAGNTGTRIRIVVPKPTLPSLRVVLLNFAMKPLVGAAWEVADPAHSGTTGATGLVEIKDLPPDRKQIVLKVTPKAPDPLPPVTPSTTPPPTVPPYPRSIEAPNFDDERHPAPPEATWVEWTLKIGSLPPSAIEPGVVTRLGNLGAVCDPAATGEAVAPVVKAYQAAFLNQVSGSGAALDIAGDLKTRHDDKP